MNPFVEKNRALWEELTPVHRDSEFYDLEGFLRGRCTLRPLELEELGPLEGRSLLHLQCHFGMDTLSWARRGVTVTGMDFSEQAIRLARKLAGELELPARFVCCDLYDLDRHLTEEFDVVYTSIGVLPWLPDLTGWGEIIARRLRPGGTFYILEGHPIAHIFDDESPEPALRVKHGYFHRPEPLRWDADGSYADRTAPVAHPSYEWTHSLGDVLGALTGAGLHIRSFRELPHCDYAQFPWMVRGADGMWRLPEGMPEVPLMFSLRAVRPG